MISLRQDRESQIKGPLAHQASSDSINKLEDIQYPINPQRALKHLR